MPKGEVRRYKLPQQDNPIKPQEVATKDYVDLIHRIPPQLLEMFPTGVDDVPDVRFTADTQYDKFFAAVTASTTVASQLVRATFRIVRVSDEATMREWTQTLLINPVSTHFPLLTVLLPFDIPLEKGEEYDLKFLFTSPAAARIDQNDQIEVTLF